MQLLKSCLISIVLATGSSAVFAEKIDTLNIPQVEGELTLDGKLDEAIWDRAEKVTLDYETRPGENTPAPVKTTAYIAQNGTSLLVAFVAEDPEPEIACCKYMSIGSQPSLSVVRPPPCGHHNR